MIIGPRYKLGRKLGAGVFDKCQTQKFMLSEARHAKNTKSGKRKQLSGYGAQLLEKQKIRFTYGLTEKQLSNYVIEATKSKKGTSRDTLFQFLESRLDNVVYRTGLANSRQQARQMVSHGHFIVNGKRTNVPSQRTKIGDVFTLRDGSKTSPLFIDIEKKLSGYTEPEWISFDAKSISGKIIGIPVYADTFLDFTSVLEFYSR